MISQLSLLFLLYLVAGVGTYTPQSKLDVNGDIRVGGTTAPCSVANEGAIRYESSSKKFQGCDGSNWVPLN